MMWKKILWDLQLFIPGGTRTETQSCLGRNVREIDPFAKETASRLAREASRKNMADSTKPTPFGDELSDNNGKSYQIINLAVYRQLDQQVFRDTSISAEIWDPQRPVEVASG